MKKIPWVMVIATMLSLLALVPGQAQDSASTITGEVYNATAGGEAPGGLPVILHVYTEDALAGTYEAEADEAGVFSFERLALNEGDLLIAATEYSGVTYTSASLAYVPGEEVQDLSIAVYETTDDPRQVTIAQMTVMLNAGEGQLRVGEYYLLGNLGDRTWVGSYDAGLGLATTTQFSLPTAAESLWFSGAGLGDRFLQDDDLLLDTAPVVPGYPSAEVFFSYAVPFTGEFEFAKAFNLPVENIEFLVAEDSGVSLQGDGIAYNEAIDTETGTAVSYIAPGLELGQALNFKLAPQKALGAGKGWEIGIGLASLAASAGVIYWLYRGKHKVVLPKAADPFLLEIAQLDAAYEAGKLRKGDYQKCREELIDSIKEWVG